MKIAGTPGSADRLLVPTYSRPPVVFERGEGAYLYDTAGKRYLDLAAGIAVAALGHSPPDWSSAVAQEAGRLTHVSNFFHTPAHIELAGRLVANSFADRVFFSNSGTEANEAALKFARRWAGTRHGEGKTQLVAFEGGFHGRTVGALSLTAHRAYREPFAPLMPGVTFAGFNDLQSAAGAISDQTCAVFVEPVQGEGGVRPADPEFLRGLRELCDRHGALLVFDEVQCGLGRTGRLWAHESYGVTPDVMTLAKPLAGGLPIGVTLVSEEVAAAIQAGDHGSTFGGGPLVCRAAQVIFDRVSSAQFLQEVRAKGEYLLDELRRLSPSGTVEVRGAGLMAGVEFETPVQPLIHAALDRGLVVISAGEKVLRLTPPLTITKQQIEEGMALLADSIAEWKAGL